MAGDEHSSRGISKFHSRREQLGSLSFPGKPASSRIRHLLVEDRYGIRYVGASAQLFTGTPPMSKPRKLDIWSGRIGGKRNSGNRLVIAVCPGDWPLLGFRCDVLGGPLACWASWHPGPLTVGSLVRGDHQGRGPEEGQRVFWAPLVPTVPASDVFVQRPGTLDPKCLRQSERREPGDLSPRAPATSDGSPMEKKAAESEDIRSTPSHDA